MSASAIRTQSRSRSGSIANWGLPGLLLLPSFILVILTFVGSIVALTIYSLQERQGGVVVDEFTFSTWWNYISDSYMWRVAWTSLRISIIVTVVCVVIGYPAARAIAMIRRRGMFITVCVLIFAPLLASVIARTYGWMLLFSDRGIVSQTASIVPLIPDGFSLMNSEPGVIIAMVHILLPFAVFTILSTVLRIPPEFENAAADLGAGGFRIFRTVLLPLASPGLLSAAQIVLALALSSYVTPALLGGGRVNVLSRLVYDNIVNLNWPMAAAQALSLLIMTIAIAGVINGRDEPG